MISIADEKRAARAAAQAVRDAAAPGADAGRRAAQFALEELAALSGVSRVAAYLSFRSEIDTGPLLDGLEARGFEIGLPVVQERARPLVFRRWRPGDVLERGVFGVEVPPESAPELIPQVLFVPLLAFTAAGYRLGYGGGFYDRTLAVLRSSGSPGCRAFGFALAVQRMEALPLEPTDLALDAVVTEQGVLRPV